MSSTEKTLLWIGVAAIVIGGAWWLVAGSKTVPSPSPSATTVTGQTTGLTSANDTSDAAIQADLTASDAQMTGLSSDSAAVTSSLNDKPIAQ